MSDRWLPGTLTISLPCYSIALHLATKTLSRLRSNYPFKPLFQTHSFVPSLHPSFPEFLSILLYISFVQISKQESLYPLFSAASHDVFQQEHFLRVPQSVRMWNVQGDFQYLGTQCWIILDTSSHNPLFGSKFSNTDAGSKSILVYISCRKTRAVNFFTGTEKKVLQEVRIERVYNGLCSRLAMLKYFDKDARVSSLLSRAFKYKSCTISITNSTIDVQQSIRAKSMKSAMTHELTIHSFLGALLLWRTGVPRRTHELQEIQHEPLEWY